MPNRISIAAEGLPYFVTLMPSTWQQLAGDALIRYDTYFALKRTGPTVEAQFSVPSLAQFTRSKLPELLPGPQASDRAIADAFRGAYTEDPGVQQKFREHLLK